MHPIVIANWKMNPETFAEAKRLFESIKKTASTSKTVDIVITPPSVFLQGLASGYKGSLVRFGIQHARAENAGSYTGDISMIQAKNAGALYALIGHAERRYPKEGVGMTNEDARAQVRSALSLAMKPVLCVGEQSRDEHGGHLAYIKEQVDVALADVQKHQFKDIVIAYEPVWAIGAKEAMLPHDIHETTLYIRKVVADKFGSKPALSMPILYGGSVDDANARVVLREGTTQGLLVGRASLDSLTFAKLVIALKNL